MPFVKAATKATVVRWQWRLQCGLALLDVAFSKAVSYCFQRLLQLLVMPASLAVPAMRLVQHTASKQEQHVYITTPVSSSWFGALLSLICVTCNPLTTHTLHPAWQCVLVCFTVPSSPCPVPVPPFCALFIWHSPPSLQPP